MLGHDAGFHFNLAMFVTKGHWGLEEGVMMGATANVGASLVFVSSLLGCIVLETNLFTMTTFYSVAILTTIH